MESTFPIIEIDADWALDDEPMGSKDKFWLERPGTSQLPWLFKYSRENEGEATGEHWAEKIAAELARMLGVPHAEVELARFNGQWGSLCRMFSELDDHAIELVHGNELLAGAIPEYDPDRRFGQVQHTLDNIFRAIRYGIGENEQRLEEAFSGIAGFVVLDALVLNTDRHHENWALFRRTSVQSQTIHWLAPTFDHASSLGREQPTQKLCQWQDDRNLDRAKWYANRGTGGVFRRVDTRKGENPLTLVELAARRWPQYLDPWLERLHKIPVPEIERIVDAVPQAAISEEHRWFARELLNYTYTRLTSLR
ncbi:HipA domain-containing protein [Halospina sp. K52047b]|uniref:HipA domain-containing protein n=1 Tax=Halospina sp. K52047b TaxID=2614160 RepID=UPI00124A5447|nr:HipA domain-containing protein [Halospina sp. K52047b]KAA8979320.1 hypothetical protein F3089_13115 [Halospina sp. K52047b]